MCDAIVDDKSKATVYSGIRGGGTIYKQKTCSRKPVVSVGPLKLCQVHGRLCKEGMMGPGGDLAAASQIKDLRNSRTRRHMYDWALDLPIVSLLLPPTMNQTNSRVNISKAGEATLSGINYQDLRNILTSAALHCYDGPKGDDETQQYHNALLVVIRDVEDALTEGIHKANGR